MPHFAGVSGENYAIEAGRGKADAILTYNLPAWYIILATTFTSRLIIRKKHHFSGWWMSCPVSLQREFVLALTSVKSLAEDGIMDWMRAIR